MQNNPDAVVINGITISDIYGFRYGMQLNEQRFFELKFRQPAFGSPFTFGLDDPAKYQDQPITLYSKDNLGRITSSIGTIVNIEFVKSPGQQAEVIIKGSMYSPTGKMAKFNLFLAGMILVPILGWIMLLVSIANLKNNLIQEGGVIKTFQEHGSKGFRTYSFKLNSYPVTFNREYNRSFKSLASDDIIAIFGSEIQITGPDENTKPVGFYILRSDAYKLQKNGQQITFFYLHDRDQTPTTTHLKYDLLDYVAATTLFSLLSFLCFIFTLVCCGGAYFCYRQYALDSDKRYVIAYYSAGVFAAILNFLLVILN